MTFNDLNKHLYQKDTIMNKIRNLLDLANHCASNPHEAETALHKANELLSKYQLDMADILHDELKTKSKDDIQRSAPIRNSETYRSFIHSLARASSLLFDCRNLRCTNRKDQSTVTFIGLEDDIALAKDMFEYLMQSWLQIVKEDTRNWKANLKHIHGDNYIIPQYDVKQYKISHGQGFTDAILMRVLELQRQRKNKLTHDKCATEQSKALIPLKDQLIKSWMEDNTQTIKGRYKEQYSSGRDDGYVAGKNLKLQDQVN